MVKYTTHVDTIDLPVETNHGTNRIDGITYALSAYGDICSAQF